MSNRFAEMEATIRHSRRGRAKKRARARKKIAARNGAKNGKNGADPETSAAMRALGKRRTLPLSLTAAPGGARLRVRAFATPVDYAVPAPFDVLAQPNPMACWATTFTMMHGWKNQACLAIESALATVGQQWVDLFSAGSGLSSSDKNTFLAAAGLVAEPPQSWSVEGWEKLLRDYGPLWVTTDEDPGPNFSIHARIITSIRGDGTPEATRIHVIDPAGGREYDETVADFIPKYESEVRATGHMRVQVVHWKAGARASEAKSLGRALARRRVAYGAGGYGRALAQESVDEMKARLISTGVPAEEIDAFLATLHGRAMGVVRARALGAPPFEINLPPASILPDWKAAALTAAATAACPAIAPLIPIAVTVSNRFGVTVGLGPAVSGGLAVGASLGVGILFAPGNRIGVYGSASGIVGAIVSISASFQLTVVKGGPEVFGGKSMAAGVSIDTGAGPQIGAHALFSMDGQFNGVTGEVGVSLGLSPFEAFAQFQYTGTVMANSLGVVPGTFARVVAFSGIPLDPGAGGMSIGPSALQEGDIILSTTADPSSAVIRWGTGSQISHASIYVGNGQVVESLADGVQIKTVANAIADDSVAVAFRFPNLQPQQSIAICDFARGKVGKKYDYWGIVRQAPFQLANFYCDRLDPAERNNCRNWNGRVFLGTQTNDTFMCSELVVAAYQAGGVPLTSTPPSWSSPEELAELRLNNKLGYVGHLKTTP
jgi:uncharacterized protein YycO